MSNPVKSKFRGVYKCGKRWKAQLQCQGIQFYLGTFDTEIEAAKAYDRKARDEKGVKGLTNFDENGLEATGSNVHFGTETYNGGLNSSSTILAENSDTASSAGKPKISSSSTGAVSTITNICATSDNVVPGMLVNINNNSVQVRMMWERLCQITQRILLCKAAHEKLYELQKSSPDRNKEGLLSNLEDEISLLTQVKQQVEEAIARSVSEGLTATLATTVAADVFAPIQSPAAVADVADSPSYGATTSTSNAGSSSGSGSIANASHPNPYEIHMSGVEGEDGSDDDDQSQQEQSRIEPQSGYVEGDENEIEEQNYIEEEEIEEETDLISNNDTCKGVIEEGMDAVPNVLSQPPVPLSPQRVH